METEWDFVNALRPLFEPISQHMMDEQSGEVKPQTFYHHINRVCVTAREGDDATVRRRLKKKG